MRRGRALAAQARVELLLTVRRGEGLLVSFVIPLGILVFFAKIDTGVLSDRPGEPVDFLVPGVLALAVISTAMVSLAIATGYERRYNVLKRLGSTPLHRRGLLVAKTLNVLVIEAVQVGLVVGVALLIGWTAPAGLLGAIPIVLLGTVAFAGLGLLLAGTLRAEATLALANGLFLVFLFLGGIAYPLAKLPDGLERVAELLPPAALAECLRGLLEPGASFPVGSLAVLVVWAVVLPAAAVRWFTWEE